MSASKTTPFPGLKESELQAISPHAVTRSFARNAVVVSEGDRGDSLYIILSGRVKFYVGDEHGKRAACSGRGQR